MKNLDELKDKITKQLKTKFEIELCESAFDNLRDKNNKLKFNNFAYSLRELSRHVFKRLSPDEKVLNCEWYENLISNRENGITRGQRIKYAIQGGIEDKYVRDDLGIDVNELNKKWKDALNIFSKHTHVNPKSFNISEEKIEEYVNKGVDCFVKLFEEIENCRDKVIETFEDSINEELIEKIFSTYFEEIGVLSTHYFYEYFDVESCKVSILNDKEIEITIEGNINIIQQYGSNSDVRKGDRLLSNESIPFEA